MLNGKKFVVIESHFDVSKRVRAYDIVWNFPGFRTHEHLHPEEVNIATLRFSYSPRRKLLEFETFYRYLVSFKDLRMTLEEAVWTIIDDVFNLIEPLSCSTSISCELNDGVKVFVNAKRGWRTLSDSSSSELSDSAQTVS